jgi:hypothetical protein
VERAQEDLVRRYCQEAEARLAHARDLGEALKIRDEVCALLESECSSSIIAVGARAYLKSIIEQEWHERSESHQRDLH